MRLKGPTGVPDVVLGPPTHVVIFAHVQNFHPQMIRRPLGRLSRKRVASFGHNQHKIAQVNGHRNAKCGPQVIPHSLSVSGNCGNLTQEIAKAHYVDVAGPLPGCRIRYHPQKTFLIRKLLGNEKYVIPQI